MKITEEVEGLLSRIKAISTVGYAYALHIKFTAPQYLFQDYPRAWMETYSKEGLVLHDPTVQWGFANTGSVRWAELARFDDAGVLRRAASFGLVHGFTLALDENGSRSLGSFARDDRDFTEGEVDALGDLAQKLHRVTRPAGGLTQAESDALRSLSLLQTQNEEGLARD